MFNNNSNNAAKLVAKSQGHKKVFATLKSNLIATNKAMLIEASNVSKKIKELQDQQVALSEESLTNDTVIRNIENILGTTK